MTDEEFLKLARECGASMGCKTALFWRHELLTLCREIERKTLERAAEEIEPFDAEPISFKSAAGLVRAMIKEKE